MKIDEWEITLNDLHAPLRTCFGKKVEVAVRIKIVIPYGGLFVLYSRLTYQSYFNRPILIP